MIITIKKEIEVSELVDASKVEEFITEEINDNLYYLVSEEIADNCHDSEETYIPILKECYKYVIDYLNEKIKEMEN